MIYSFNYKKVYKKGAYRIIMGFWLNVLSVVAILVILIALYSFTRKSPRKYFKKAMKMHKLGELYHNEGDTELSNDYYDEAEDYRKKGRELENVV